MSSQQQQQSNPVKPQKIGATMGKAAGKAFTGSPTASMLKGLYQGPKALKSFGLIKGAKAGGMGSKLPKKGSTYGVKRSTLEKKLPSMKMVQSSIRRTMGH